jgi:para-aminobenzoate synthetase/4-amino-4-deoxychorismate lyase
MSNTVLLHDAARGQWLSFRRPARVLAAHTLAEVLPALREAEALVDDYGLYAAGFVSYEASPAFDPSFRVRPAEADFPLVWFGLYPEPEVVPPPVPPAASMPSNGDWSPSVTRAEYAAAIDCIQAHIARGDTYQVNYTFRLRRAFDGDARALFASLAQAQQSAYAAYVDIGRFAICSASPELFFARDGRRVTARPMKGTAPRGRWSAEDRAKAAWLRGSEKNRAENVMIVDMLRNDLGRVAQVGSVRVPRLFEVERYPTVWQMTSTVEAETVVPNSDLMAALFPCASITGAPKTRTTQIIAELERDPRRIYTGCVGFMAPGRRAQFNVAIRTVLIDRASSQAEYGVGGGIVWDSIAADEYEECRDKARVLSEPRPQFALFETLLWSPHARAVLDGAVPDRTAISGRARDGGYWLLDYHLRRLERSAEYFGFALRAGDPRARLEALARTLAGGAFRVRLQLEADGEISINALPLEGRGARCARELGGGREDDALRLELAPTAVDSGQHWLYHKTTHRQVYDTARAARPGADDVLLWNERGEATETTIGNIVARVDGRLVTPPLACGLLPGTLRAYLLDQGEIVEQVIRLDQLAGCELYRINALRGWERVQLPGLLP